VVRKDEGVVMNAAIEQTAKIGFVIFMATFVFNTWVVAWKNNCILRRIEKKLNSMEGER
jgi:hypothetical protein